MFGAEGQAQAFLATVYAGLAAGVAYDLLRLLRLSLRAGHVMTALLDIVFWVIAATLVAVAAALSGAPGLRYYLVLGAASGVLLWAAGLRRIMAETGRMAGQAISSIRGTRPLREKPLRSPPEIVTNFRAEKVAGGDDPSISSAEVTPVSRSRRTRRRG